MKQVVKRLELISLAIILEENDIIISQTKKLRKFPLDKESSTIANMLEKHSYEEAIVQIKNYLKKFTDIGAYKDPLIQGVKMEIQTFEHNIASLAFNKYNILRNIYSFNTAYQSTLGVLAKEIIELKITQTNKSSQNAKESQHAKNRYGELLEILSKQPSPQKHLNQSEQEELERAYKKVAFIINPQLVVQEFQEEATSMYVKLNQAYINQDLQGIKAISSRLRDGASYLYGIDKIEDKKELRTYSKLLRQHIESLEDELIQLQNNQIAQFIKDTQTMKSFFAATKKELLEKKAYLEKSIQ